MRRSDDEIGIDLGQRLTLRGGQWMAEARQGLGAQRAVAGEATARPRAQPASDDRERDLIGQQFVIGEPGPVDPSRHLRWRLDRVQALGEARPFLAPQQRRVVPLGKRRQPRQRLRHGVRHLTRPEAAGQRPHRLDCRQQFGPVGGNHVLRMRHRATAAEQLDLAGHQQLRADRHLAFPIELEKDQIGGPGPVGHHHAPRLARIGRRLDSHHLNCQRDDLARPRLGDCRALAAIQVGFRQVEQQVDHALAAGHLGDQRADRRADALQRG